MIDSQSACEIARLDRHRFNEAVHAGFYPAAPPTRKGARRFFSGRDLARLCIYADLIRAGMSASFAGPLVADLDMEDEEVRVRIGKSIDLVFHPRGRPS